MSRSFVRAALAAAVSGGLLLAVSVSGPSASAAPPEDRGTNTWLGEAQAFGQGQIRSYVVRHGNTPLSIGVRLDGAVFDGLPMDMPTDMTHCFDANGDGVMDHMECVGGYEQRLLLPSQKHNDPFRWVMINWNPMGHSGMVYPEPHIDFHFYIASQADTDAIRMGPCAEMINCDDYVTALKPMAPEYLPAGYLEIEGAAEGMMGNHMIDPTSGIGPDFTRALIYGKYDAKITFVEPMITRAWIQSVSAPGQRKCDPIAQPQKWQTPGWYPTSYCVTRDADDTGWTVSLEGLARG